MPSRGPGPAAVLLLVGTVGCLVLGPEDRTSWWERGLVVMEPVLAPGHEDALAGVGNFWLRVTDASPGWSGPLDWHGEGGELLVELPAQEGAATLHLEGYAGYDRVAGFLLLRGAATPVVLPGGERLDLPIFLAPVEQAAALDVPASFGAALASDGAGRFFLFGGTAAGLANEPLAAARDEIAVLSLSAPSPGLGLEAVGTLEPAVPDTGAEEPASGCMNMTATLLSHGAHAEIGHILLTGGWEAFDRGASVRDQILLFDPRDGQLEAAGMLAEPRAGHVALELDDGQVLVLGGYTRAPEDEVICARTVEVYDPASRALTAVSGALSGCLVDGAGATLGDQVLWCGGLRIDAEGFGAEPGCWLFGADAEPIAVPSPLEPGQGLLLPAMASLGRGRALLTGGAVVEGSLPRLAGAEEDWAWAQAGSWIFDAAHRIWKRTEGDMLLPRAAHVALALPGRRVLVAGGASGLTNLGRNVRDPTACAEVYDLSQNAWELLQPCSGGTGVLANAVHRPSGATDPLYGALILGGLDLRESASGAALYLGRPGSLGSP